MGTFLVYILKSSVCLALFYLFYRLLMSKETFHRFNRCALLVILGLVALLPLVKVNIGHAGEMQQAIWALEDRMSLSMDGMLMDGMPGEAVEGVSAISWAQVLLLAYLLGLIGCLGYQVFSFVRLGRLLLGARRESLADFLFGYRDVGARLLVHDEEVSPFSWMSYVVVARKDLRENGREILLHELAHIKHRHSWDLLLVDVCILIQWFNPAAWLLKQELQTIHEYEADDTVLACGVNARDYQMLLIKKAVGARLYSIANNLNHSSLKKRITMMIKKKSNPWARAKYLYVLPLAAMAVVAFARPEVSNELDEISSVKVNDLTSIVKAEEVKSVENSSKRLEDVGMTGDADAVQNERGHGNPDPESVPEAQKESYRQVSMKVNRKATDNDVMQIKSIWVRKGKEEWMVRKKADQNPLIVVNDEVKENIDLQDIPVEDILAIYVMKGEKAVAQYGERAKDGAIVITLKQDKKI